MTRHAKSIEKPLIVICGPTASGKTDLSLHLAKQLDAEIVSADSMQIYRGMDIGTAKPTTKEKENIPHHMLDIIDVGAEFSVADYVRKARECIDDIHHRKKIPLLVGGTSLYIQAVVDNVYFADIPSDLSLRSELRQIAQEKGNEALWDRLKSCDPALADTLHPNNLGRIIRGIEAYTLTGKPLSLWQEESRKYPSPYQECMLGIGYQNRNTLYNRINHRVDSMLENGLLKEVEWFYAQEGARTAKQAIGYKELLSYIQGTESLEQATERLKQESRRYAKRQFTWMRNEQRIHWLYRDSFPSRANLYQAAENIIMNWFSTT